MLVVLLRGHQDCERNVCFEVVVASRKYVGLLLGQSTKLLTAPDLNVCIGSIRLHRPHDGQDCLQRTRHPQTSVWSLLLGTDVIFSFCSWTPALLFHLKDLLVLERSIQ